MATAGIKLTSDFPELEKLQQGLRNVFGKKEMAAVLKEALEVAIWPAYLRLREITPRGPTGNLLRAANHKTKSYPRDGAAVGLIGYNQSGTASSTSAQGGRVEAGPDRAFHQWWLENGTKTRLVKKFSNKPYQRRSKLGNVHWVSGQNTVIASSYGGLGPFRMIPGSGGKFTTDPLYPKAFFRKAKKGESQIVIPETPAGGVAGLPPVRTAWEQSQGKVAFMLQQELGNLLDKAVAAIGISKQGTLSERAP